MSKKEIWFINHYGSKRHDTFTRYLSEDGYNITLFRSSFLHSRRKQRVQGKVKFHVEQIYGGRQVLLKTLGYQKNGSGRILNILSYYFSILRYHKKFSPPDVIIASTPHPLALLAGIRIARKYKCKLLIEIRDLWPQTFVDMKVIRENSIPARVLYWIEKFAVSRADKVISLLPGMTEYFKARGLDTTKLVHIPNGIDVEEFDRAGETSLIEVDKYLNLNKFNAIYAGAHGRANRLDIILQAAKIIQDKKYFDIHFNFFGDGEKKAEYIKLAEDLGLKNTTFHEKITKLELAKIITNCDVNLFNLENLEVFKYGISSNKLFDYMASRKPIIFACNASNNFIKDANCGISIRPEDPLAFAEAVLQIYSLAPEERVAMGQRGRKYLEKNFDYPQLAQSLKTLL